MTAFPPQATGESSPEGGFPAVGNWRTRRACGVNQRGINSWALNWHVCRSNHPYS